MSESNLAVMSSQPTAVVVSNEWEKQLDLIARTVAPGLSPEEFQLFCHVARVRHLDPLQRQIHAVKRRTWNKQLNGGKGGYDEMMTIQTGIDGYRAIANRTGTYMPSDKPALIEDQGKDTMRITMGVKKFHAASGTWHEFSATAYYREFVQTRKTDDGKYVPNAMWEKMPVNQLTKCAEALALRKGWPEELGGIYVDEEMQHNDSPQYMPPDPAAPKQDKTKRDLGTMKPSISPNRGHGNEGTVQVENTICAECRGVNGHKEDCKNHPKNKAKTSKKPEGKQDRRAAWVNQPGHDPKIHIGFDDAIQLFELQRDLKISDEDMKAFLDKNFEIQHRYLIRQADFQLVLDALRKEYGPKEPETETVADDGSDLAGMFDTP